MKKLFEIIIRLRYIIMIVFLLIAGFCAYCRQFVKVDYDINDYLPASSASTLALDKMEAEFEGAIPNARIMKKEKDKKAALKFKKELEAVDGVESVTWLDDALILDIDLPMSMYPTDTLETYYKDGYAIYSVTVNEEKQNETIPLLYDVIGDDGYMTGSAVSTAVATSTTVVEVKKIAICSVLFLIFVLLITTTSWMEPLIVLAGLGVAILINAGSNLIFGEISFVTNAAGNILQLAVSLDYSVFLIHRFEEQRKETTDIKLAMRDALTMSFSSISSSGLTTVIGFLALCMMSFRIGPDLGLALAKGVAISLITVFSFMPGLILCTFRWMDKTAHRSFMPSFRKTGRFIRKITIPLSIVFILIIIPSYMISNKNSYNYGSSHIFGRETRLGSDTQKIKDVFGESDTYVLMVPKGDKKLQKRLVDELEGLSQIKSITSLAGMLDLSIPTEMIPSQLKDKLESDNCDRIVLNVSVDYEGEKTFALVKKIREIAEDYYPDEWYLAGQGVSTYDLMKTTTADMVKVNLLAIGAVFLVLLITMKSIALPVVLVMTIETAIWINLSIPYIQGKNVFYIAYLIISSIQLGATVDYAILLTERYKENRIINALDKKDAIVETISNVTVSILTSGITLTVVGYLMGVFSTHGLLSQLGYFLGNGTICSLISVLFVLPGFLYMTDRIFIKKRGSD